MQPLKKHVEAARWDLPLVALWNGKPKHSHSQATHQENLQWNTKDEVTKQVALPLTWGVHGSNIGTNRCSHKTAEGWMQKAKPIFYFLTFVWNDLSNSAEYSNNNSSSSRNRQQASSPSSQGPQRFEGESQSLPSSWSKGKLIRGLKPNGKRGMARQEHEGAWRLITDASYYT